MNPGRQKSECFDQTLHMGIKTFKPAKIQPEGNVFMTLCKFRRYFANERQFTIIVGIELIHRIRASSTLKCPNPVSNTAVTSKSPALDRAKPTLAVISKDNGSLLTLGITDTRL